MILLTSIMALISSALILINLLISKKTLFDREKMSPFECGFDPKVSARMPFSLRFYLIAVIFLIFDVEIALILPMPLMTFSNKKKSMIMLSSFFIFILLAGLFHEWKEGALNWDL